jgi:CubicO group peptidase (beta-lactamase class C family)
VRALPRLQAKPPRRFDALPWPTGDLRAEAARPAGAALTGRVAAAFDRKTYGEGSETTAVLVVADGRIVAERYRAGFDKHTPQRTWSVAKSIAATVIGAAVQEGLLDVKRPALVPEWRRPGDPRARITLENLLHMSSGLYSEQAGNRTDMTYFGGTAVTEETTGLPLEAPPGRRWLYANNDTLLAVRALRAAIGDDRRYLAYPFQKVFWRIGMARTTPETDWDGNFILSSQVWTTARDLARLGLLHLNDGVWEGERVLPAGWVRYVTTPAPAQPTGAGPGYGAQWWLYGPKHGLPEGTYAARGNRGQYLVIVPSRRVVVVRRGFDAVGAGGGQFDIAKFTAEVLADLERP